MRWWNSQHDHTTALLSYVQGSPYNFLVFTRTPDVVVRWQHRHQSVAFCEMPNVKGRQGNSCRSVAADRLHKHSFSRIVWQLLAHLRLLFAVCHCPDALRGHYRTKSRNSLLQHRSFTDDVQKLFGSFGAALRPETRAASACQDDRVNGKIFARHRAIRTECPKSFLRRFQACASFRAARLGPA